MSILDKASLIQIPSGYKSTKLYSIKPINGDGDFTFARSSSATRVNSEGLIEVAGVVSTTEEVTNGDFATDSDWTKGVGWTISGGTANSSGLNSNLQQNAILVVGKKYEIKITVINYVSGTVEVSAGASPRGQITANGTYTFTQVCTPATNFYVISQSFTGSIDNVSVKEVIENDVPRLDYSGGASCASLLLEPQRTNVINYSNNYTQWSNTQFTINGNSVTSPEGITSGTKIVPSTSNTEKYLDKGGFVRTSGQYITHTVYAKASGYNFLYLSNSASRLYAVYDLQQGLVIYNNSNGSDFNNHSASIELFGNGWYKCELIGQAQSSFASYFRISCGITAINSSTQGLFQGDGTSGIEVYGSQVELNASYATSYIPTQGSSVTRNADACSISNVADRIGQTEGVIFIDFELQTTGEDFVIMNLYNTSSPANGIYFYLSYSRFLNAYCDNGGNQVLIASGVLSEGRFKAAFAYKENDFAFYLNGSLIGVDNSGTVPTCGALRLENYQNSPTYQEKTKVYQAQLYNTRLSNSELATLTTL